MGYYDFAYGGKSKNRLEPISDDEPSLWLNKIKAVRDSEAIDNSRKPMDKPGKTYNGQSIAQMNADLAKNAKDPAAVINAKVTEWGAQNSGGRNNINGQTFADMNADLRKQAQKDEESNIDEILEQRGDDGAHGPHGEEVDKNGWYKDSVDGKWKEYVKGKGKKKTEQKKYPNTRVYYDSEGRHEVPVFKHSNNIKNDVTKNYDPATGQLRWDL